MNQLDPAFLDHEGTRIAYRLRDGSAPTLVFLPGYASDMEGSKALALDAFAQKRGLAMLRLDYSGTGSSEGRFQDGTLERWIGEACALLDRVTDGPLILLGSSMGGWIALHLALRRASRVQALVGIAAAPDFTDWGYSAEEKRRIAADGRLERPSAYDDGPHVIHHGFWESGEQLRLLDKQIAIGCPVRLVHGDADADVPLDVAMRLKDALRSADVQLTILKHGGHRLSEPHQIDAIVRVVAALVEPAP
jgi:pimeloyl-ACP methyl ester carboxylesterase